MGPGVDGSLPPHPLSVSAVHPLLVHHTDSAGTSSLGLNPPVSSTTLTSGNIAANAFQISGTGINAPGLGGAGTALGSAISPILRTMRQHFNAQSLQYQPAGMPMQQQQQPARPLRVSRFVLPGIQLQLPAQGANNVAPSTSNQQQQQQPQPSQGSVSGLAAAPPPPPPPPLPQSIRSASLPYNTLNEILQGFETPASAMQAPPALITAPSATSFIDMLTGQAIANAAQHRYAK